MVLRVRVNIEIHAFCNPAIAYCTRNVRIEDIVLRSADLIGGCAYIGFVARGFGVFDSCKDPAWASIKKSWQESG